MEILRDPKRLDAAIDAMSNFLAQTMHITDPELVPNIGFDLSAKDRLKKHEMSAMRENHRRKLDIIEQKLRPFGTVLYEEFNYKTTPEEEKTLGSIHKVVCHADNTVKMAAMMLEESEPDYQGDIDESEEDETWKAFAQSPEMRENIDLLFYAYHFSESPYFFKCQFEMPLTSTVLTIGGISGSLCTEFKRLYLEWLRNCDKIFCQLYGMDASPNEDYDDFLEKVSLAIARRNSLLKHPNDPDLKEVDIPMEPRFFECRSDAEFRKHNEYSYNQKKVDTTCLKDLLVLAKEGGESAEAKEIILTRISNIASVINSPPQELWVHGDKRKHRFNFDMLRNVLNAGINHPFLHRCAIVNDWKENHGQWVATEIAKAIEWIWRRDFRCGTTYLDVASTTAKQDSVKLPSNPCAYENLDWFAHPPDYTKRAGLPGPALRLVCMASFLYKRLEKHTLKFGTSNKQIIRNVATYHFHHARYSQTMLENERMRHNRGVSLLMFERDLHDFSSDVSFKLTVPMCTLSGFSMEEINLVFGRPEIFQKVSRELSSRTMKVVSRKDVPEQYFRFTDDALTIMLDAFNLRRSHQGIYGNRWTTKTDALSDMLRSVPKIQHWNPSHGSLRLHLEDLKQAPSDLRNKLDECVKANTGLVAYSSTRSKARIEYVFDSLKLMYQLSL
jgi:hypothetical protein